MLPLYLHPVSVEGRPAVGARREKVTWDDPSISFGGHLWRLLGLAGARFEVHVGEEVTSVDHDRKALARLSRERMVALAEPLIGTARIE